MTPQVSDPDASEGRWELGQEARNSGESYRSNWSLGTLLPRVLSSLRVAGAGWVRCAQGGGCRALPGGRSLLSLLFASCRALDYYCYFFFIPLLVCPVFPSPFLSQVDFFFFPSSPGLPMSLLGSYRKKTSSDGYESLQLVDSHGDSSARGAAAGTQRVTTGAVRSPARQPPHRASTTDSSGSGRCGAVLRPGAHPRSRLGEAGL